MSSITRKYSITRKGPLNLDFYRWDEKTKTLIINRIVSDFVLDFSDYDGVTFKTGDCCTFKTGSNCTFETGSFCTFTTGSGCTFKTGHDCTFETGHDCVIIRRDIFEVINMNDIKTKKIKLNGAGKAGYEIIK